MRLPARRSVSMSRDVVDDQQARGDQPDRHGQRERLPVEVLDLNEERPRHGDDPEEQEHEHLSQPLIAIRFRAARVEHAGQDRGRPDHEQLPPGHDDEVDAGEHSDAEGEVGRDQDLTGRDEPAGRDPYRAKPVLGVGAPTRIGVVVGEVGADLDEHRADQRGDEPQRVEHVQVTRERGTDQHGCDRRRQGPHARGHQPDANAARPGGLPCRCHHARRGNFEKSGLRFSRYALRPSCASSLM